MELENVKIQDNVEVTKEDVTMHPTKEDAKLEGTRVGWNSGVLAQELH